MRDASAGAAAEGERWLTGGEAVRRVTAEYPHTKHDTIRHLIAFYCINDRLRKHSGGQMWRRNPLYVTDGPSMRGKRYRLLTGGEREAFLADPRADLEFASYAQVPSGWLAASRRRRTARMRRVAAGTRTARRRRASAASRCSSCISRTTCIATGPRRSPASRSTVATRGASSSRTIPRSAFSTSSRGTGTATGS